jgi:hypothetical protein
LPSHRLAQQEEVADAAPLIFVVDAGGPAGRYGQRRAGLSDQLLAGLVQADDRPRGIGGPLVDVEHVLHAGDERPVRLRRDDPLLLPVGLQFVF